MAELKHTPGPWAVGYASPEKLETSTLAIWQLEDLEGGCGSVICKISPEAQMNETDKANAKLIAAAPDLLEAMEEMIDAFYPYNPHTVKTESAMKNAKAAIAKATLTTQPDAE